MGIKRALRELGGALKDDFGSASRKDCETYARMLDYFWNGDEEERPSEKRAREEMAAKLPAKVREMVESGRF